MSDRQYELVYILPPDTTDQQVTDLHGQIESVVSRMSGQIEKTENWGRRKLAYEIGPHKEGVYGLEVIIGSGELMKELDRRLRVMDLVVRHMVVRVDAGHKGVRIARQKILAQMDKKDDPLAPPERPGDALQDVKARQAVADQQAAGMINDTIRQANRLVQTDPDAARVAL